MKLQRDQVDSRLAKLTDLIVDGTVDRSLFLSKQNALLLERARVNEKLDQMEQSSDGVLTSLEKTVELAKSPSLLYQNASRERKRELLKTLLSNIVVCGKNVEIMLALPFQLIADRQKETDGGPNRGTCRTWEQLLRQLYRKLNEQSATLN